MYSVFNDIPPAFANYGVNWPIKTLLRNPNSKLERADFQWTRFIQTLTVAF